MIQLDPFDLSLSLDEFISSYGVAMDDLMNQFDSFSPPLTLCNDSLETSHANFDYLPDGVKNFPVHVNEVPFHDEFPMDCSSFDLEDLRDLFEVDVSATLVLPREEMKIDNELSARHIAKAYAEAMEDEKKEIAKVIARRINEKFCPIGDVRERLLYHSFQPLNKQAENNYLHQEASKVFDEAFEAIYRMIPNGTFAHFRANMAILEALPYDAEVLHVVDFDMGDGVQWPSMITATAQQQSLLLQHGVISQQMKLKLTSIKWEEDYERESSQWRFEETKNRLHDCAYSHGLNLKVKEIQLQDLVTEVKKMKKNSGGKREWLAFNCMHGLPHMGRRRSKRHVMQFLNMAKDCLAYCANSKTSKNRGIITFGDGENWGKIRNLSCFGSFFESFMDHYQALLESIEWNFPKGLAQARIAMECLFVAPFVDSLALLEEWKEIKEFGDFQTGLGSLQGVGFSNESLMEAKVMVSEGASLYSVRIEGEYENEMVLEWRGSPLVRVYAWRL